MLRSVTAFFIIAVLLTANFSRLFIYVGFELNKKYIASELCENITKPKLDCKGSCYLKKKLKQAEEKEQSDESISKKHNFQEALISEKTILFTLPKVIALIRPAEIPFSIVQHASDIFQPPRA